jgi:two-component system C4-dicarboxylate transport response regulator DctD
MRILFADDEELFGRATVLLLSRGGHECQRVTTASQAIGFARVGGYDAIVTDAQLPDHEPVAYLSAMRVAAPTVPIIVLSGDPGPVIRGAADRVRADFLAKPFEIEALLDWLALSAAAEPGGPPTP